MEKDKAIQILEYRKEAVKNDDEVYQKKREDFLNWLSVWNYNPSIKVLEMYPNDLKTNLQIYQFFNKKDNTRTKSFSETRLEIDKLPLNKAITIICESCLNLIKLNFHFAGFYAAGQRSPHIIIYDAEELKELTPYQRFKAQAFFWRKIMPFGLFQYADSGIWQDECYVPLEFAPHWKYHTIFNLLFEHIPLEKKCKN